MEAKQKYELEFLLRTSSRILFNQLNSPSGLAGWFSDDVNINDDIFTFQWEGSEEQARLISQKKNEYVRFHWMEDEEDDTFFELRIREDAMTGEVALLVTDFAEEDEVDEAKELWESHIDALRQKLGA